MKKLALNLLFIFVLVGYVSSQKMINFPSSRPLIQIPVDTNKWTSEDSDGVITLTPKHETSGNYFCMIWTTDNPSSETAIDDLATQATGLVNSLLEDVTWSEDVTDFENNGMSFVGMDGKGYYASDDGTHTKFSASVILLLPDGVSCIAIVFFGASNLYDKYENDLVDLMLGIKKK